MATKTSSSFVKSPCKTDSGSDSLKDDVETTEQEGLTKENVSDDPLDVRMETTKQKGLTRENVCDDPPDALQLGSNIQKLKPMFDSSIPDTPTVVGPTLSRGALDKQKRLLPLALDSNGCRTQFPFPLYNVPTETRNTYLDVELPNLHARVDQPFSLWLPRITPGTGTYIPNPISYHQVIATDYWLGS
ncbi:hypothetical protein SESBI_49229 [Sesbania bispinosa]|nr:hypothetical protein SESBI_49229 [Sesbania bispinosa]